MSRTHGCRSFARAFERLAAVHARGIVTDAEFVAKRIALLERI